MINNKDLYSTEVRQLKIMEYFNKVDKATIDSIIEITGVSRSTVRRDLIELERKNIIVRTRGGALKKKFFKYEIPLNEKKVLNLEQKRKIGGIARKYINEGDIIYISGGTTTLELAKTLLDVKNLVVFTNAINIVLEIVNYSDIKIKLVGGNFRRNTFSTVGQGAINYLGQYNFDKAFVGVDGISIKEGFTTPNELEAIVDGMALLRSKEKFILADESKFESIAFSTICRISDVDYIITNRIKNKNLIREIKKENVNIIWQ